MPTPDKASTPSPTPVPRPGWLALAREFLRELFDLRFTTFMATRMLPVIYVLGIGLAGLFTVYVVYRRFEASLLEGLLWLVLGPLLFFGVVTALRITLEFVLAVFRMAWYVEHVAANTGEMRKDMPKFGWWRTLLFGESGEPPKPRDKEGG